MRSFRFLLIALVFAACNTTYAPTGTVVSEAYRIGQQLSQDTAILRLTQPYRDSVVKSMEEIVGHVDATLEKEQPSGTLNNFMADAMLFAARQKIDPAADAAFVNNGGIRITQLPAGPVSRGKIFELMPFDNILVVQEMKGAVLQQFLDLVADKGGWPAAGITMEINNKKAVKVKIGGQPLDQNRTYKIVNSDYIVGGGDNADMLKPLPTKNTGYLMRDAIFDYIKALKREGKNITPATEKRTTNAQ
jgi:2',3'-cyclic-nucleotide 2'-phosphodiesterase (5'-nucleotidase family)